MKERDETKLRGRNANIYVIVNCSVGVSLECVHFGAVSLLSLSAVRPLGSLPFESGMGFVLHASSI